MPIRSHEASEPLRTPEDIAAYINAAIEESDGDPRLLTKAFGTSPPPCRSATSWSCGDMVGKSTLSFNSATPFVISASRHFSGRLRE